MKYDYDRMRRERLMQKDFGNMEKRIVKKLHIDCSFKPEYSERLADFLDERGYRYGYNGKPCERRSPKNMPFIVIDVTNGFYHGSKGADTAVHWHKACERTFYQLEQNLPDLAEIQEKARQNDGAIDNHMRAPSKDGRKMERMWYTATGRAMGISRMNDDHLHNTILLVDRTIADGGDQIGNNTDLAHLLNELEDERIHRGLHLPLVPFKSLEYRKGNHNYV